MMDVALDGGSDNIEDDDNHTYQEPKHKKPWFSFWNSNPFNNGKNMSLDF